MLIHVCDRIDAQGKTSSMTTEGKILNADLFVCKGASEQPVASELFLS